MISFTVSTFTTRQSLIRFSTLLFITLCSSFSVTTTAFVAPQRTRQHQHPKRLSQNDHPIRQRQPFNDNNIIKKSSSYSSSSTSILQFWSRSDPPISSLVDVSANYTLAATDDIVHLHEGQRLVCLGDVHGDMEALREFLTLAQVYDPHTDSWCGNNAILVQCGDILDRGTQELQCLQLLAKMSHQAQAQNGKVIVLVGNHEVLNAMGLFQYALGDEEYEERVAPVVDAQLGTKAWRTQYVGNQPARWATYEPGGLLAASLLANMKVAVKVGRTVLVHAGLRPEHIQKYGGIPGMNQAFRDWIQLSVTSGWSGDNPVTYNNRGKYVTPNMAIQDAERRQTYYINSIPEFLSGGVGATGPIWMRDYSSPSDMPPRNPQAQTMIDQTLDLLNADRMVMGHTIQRQINGALDGKAWRVDVGASRGCIAGAPEVLEIARVCVDSEYYGSSCEEQMSVLTKHGKVPADQRLVTAMINYL
ncbi:calcineurin-like phosphoesterase [Nitzschia inconspicua]|uniref:Calcineurin-like phosphoesterase n=1 Tax=Nitzschia inconspicua TaxID=303405 RepID=A0A9K3KIP2_9STRA|nr:calcineurin-like phosphoesterase [Nitzschia inconspicua]KAG7344419.1 calcineurin-like phosphoesterase [Nitzschia inconspicua]